MHKFISIMAVGCNVTTNLLRLIRMLMYIYIIYRERFESHEWPHPNEEWKTTIELRIKQLQKEDLEEYRCIAKSSMGEAESTLRLYGKIII